MTLELVRKDQNHPFKQKLFAKLIKSKHLKQPYKVKTISSHKVLQ